MVLHQGCLDWSGLVWTGLDLAYLLCSAIALHLWNTKPPDASISILSPSHLPPVHLGSLATTSAPPHLWQISENCTHMSLSPCGGHGGHGVLGIEHTKKGGLLVSGKRAVYYIFLTLERSR